MRPALKNGEASLQRGSHPLLVHMGLASNSTELTSPEM